MKLAYSTAAGVAIVVAAPKADIEKVLGPLTDFAYRTHVISRSIPKNTPYTVLPDDWAPPDTRDFRNAWQLAGNVVSVDMVKARDVHLGRIRQARDVKLAALDQAWMKNVTGNPAEANKVEAQRQKLRDLPQTFDLSSARTPAELRALWPAELA